MGYIDPSIVRKSSGVIKEAQFLLSSRCISLKAANLSCCHRSSLVFMSSKDSLASKNLNLSLDIVAPKMGWPVRSLKRWPVSRLLTANVNELDDRVQLLHSRFLEIGVFVTIQHVWLRLGPVIPNLLVCLLKKKFHHIITNHAFPCVACCFCPPSSPSHSRPPCKILATFCLPLCDVCRFFHLIFFPGSFLLGFSMMAVCSTSSAGMSQASLLVGSKAASVEFTFLFRSFTLFGRSCHCH